MRRISLKTTLLFLGASILAVCFIFPSNLMALIESSMEKFDEFGHPITIMEAELKDSLGNLHETHHKEEDEDSKKLFNVIKVLCFILTSPEFYDTKAKHILATWGKRCNKVIFMSSTNDSSIGAVAVVEKEGRKMLSAKSFRTMKHIYDNYLNDYHWFFKCDSDTFAIMENMRHMLSAYDPSVPIWFGSRYNKYTNRGYHSGGAGYVMSRAALRKVVEDGLQTGECKEGWSEDVYMGKCMDKLNITYGDSRDSLERGRFFPFPPHMHLLGYGVMKWYYDYVYYKPAIGLNCCSDWPNTFHYIKPQEMYEMEYLLYHVRPYGIGHKDPVAESRPVD